MVQMRNPLFSCVVPVKGLRPFIKETLASLQAQGMHDRLEVIIQDGDVEPDSGQSDAINRGFARAKGEWLFWLNADDILMPEALKVVSDLIEARGRNVEWIAGGTQYFDAQGRRMDVRIDKRWHGFLYRHLPVWTYGPSSFFRRELLSETGGLDSTLKFTMDVDLWTRFCRRGVRYEMIDRCLWGFRVHRGSLTTGGAYDAERHAEWNELLARYGMTHVRLFEFLMRLTRLLDGSQFLTWCETRRGRGKLIE